jgi:hypothetical protein
LHDETVESFDYTKQTAFIEAFAATTRTPTNRISLELLFASFIMLDYSKLSAGSSVISADFSLNGFTVGSFGEVAQQSVKVALATALTVEIENIYIKSVVGTYASDGAALSDNHGSLLVGDGDGHSNGRRLQAESLDPDPVPAISVTFEIVVEEDSSNTHLAADVQEEIMEFATNPESVQIVAIDVQTTMVEMGTLPPAELSVVLAADSISVVQAGPEEPEHTTDNIVAKVTATFDSESDAAETVEYLQEDDAQEELAQAVAEAGITANIETSSLQAVVVTLSPTAAPVVTPTASPVSFRPVVNIVGSDQVKVDASINAIYSDHGAVCSDAQHGDLSQNLVITGLPNLALPGAYIVTYNCNSGSDGGDAIPATRTVTVVDAICPLCTLVLGGTTVEASFPYTDPGCSCEGFFPRRELPVTAMAVEGAVDVEAVGTYVVTYRVKGTRNEDCINEQSLYRTVIVRDTLMPVITLKPKSGGSLDGTLEDVPHTSLLAIRSRGDAVVLALSGALVGGVAVVMATARRRRR